MKQGLTKNDSSRIGFVMSCLYSRALSIEEMKQWVTCVYEEDDSPPLYFIDLLEFKPPLAGIFKVIGFVPGSPFTDEEETALFGIAQKRGNPPIDCPFTGEEALGQLQKYPQVEKRFRQEFPFIELS